jgi:hypothetical protein
MCIFVLSDFQTQEHICKCGFIFFVKLVYNITGFKKAFNFLFESVEPAALRA